MNYPALATAIIGAGLGVMLGHAIGYAKGLARAEVFARQIWSQKKKAGK